MALTNLRVQLARPMVGSGVAERSMIGSCTTTRSMNWQLYDDDIDSWQSRGTEAYTVDASVAELGVRRMYLEIWTTESDRRYSRSTDRERTCEGESIGTSGTYSATHQRAELHCMERYSEPLLRGNQSASGMSMSLCETSQSFTVKVKCLRRA